MNNMNIIDVNEVDFETKVIEESANKLIIVDFWAPWCGPCKQLTPLLEKIISSSPNKITLAKINIDDNQQIAAQLRIQSVPTVFAFKDKQVVNAFQGIISEKDIIKFLEKALGEKLENNFDEFYVEVKLHIKNKNFDQAKEILEIFISENSKEVKAICFYAECLIETNETTTANEFLNGLDKELFESEEVKNIMKRINLIINKNKGPSIKDLEEKLSKSPNDLGIIFKIADLYFAENDFDNSFKILLQYYPKNKDKVKSKMISFFDVLGFNHNSVIEYRKKLSSIMFS